MKYDAVFHNLKAEKVINLAKKLKVLSHAYLFICKDEAFARIYSYHVAKRIISDCEDCGKCNVCRMIDGGSHPDFAIYPKKEGDKLKVDDVLEIIEKAYLRPVQSTCKIFVIDGLHNMQDVAQNKLLKILEEPPKDTYFLLTARSENSVLSTVKSRSTKIVIEDFSQEDIYDYLKDSVKDTDKLRIVASSSYGKITDAVKSMKSDKAMEQYKRAFNVILNMKKTADIVNVIDYFSANDEEVILSFMEMIYRDMLMIRSNSSHLLSAKHMVNELKELSKNFTDLALIESIDVVIRAIERLKFNVNKTSNTDAILMELMEVKYNCQ